MTYTIEDKSSYHHYSHNNVSSSSPTTFLPILMVVNALLNCFLNQLKMRQRKRTKEKLNGNNNSKRRSCKRNNPFHCYYCLFESCNIISLMYIACTTAKSHKTTGIVCH